MNANQTTTQTLDIKKILSHFLRVWYLYLALGVVLITGALLFLKFSAKTYTASAKVVLNLSQQRVSNNNNEEYFNLSSIINQETSIQNELSVLSSTPLIEEVIRDMDLKVSYYQKVDKIPKEFTFNFTNIYRQSPFLVIPNEEHWQPIGTFIYINILSEEEFIIATSKENVALYNYSSDRTNYTFNTFKLDGIYKFGEEITSDFCSFKVLLNSNYIEQQFKGKDLFFRFNSFEHLTSSFKNALTVEGNSLESTLVNLSFTAENALLSVDFLSDLIDKYIEKSLNEKNYLASKTIEYIDFQLSNISDSLGRSEQELQNFRRNYNVMDIDEKAGTIVNQMQLLENNRDVIQTRLGYLQQMKQYFEDNEDMTSILAPSSIGLDDPLLNSLIQELTSLSSEKQQIIINGQLNNPRLKTLNTSILNLKNAISENINFSIKSTNNALNEINVKIASLRSEYRRLPQTQRRLLGIERQFNLNDAVYTSLLEKRIQAEISRASNLPDCEVIEPAQYAGIASPNRIFVLAISVFLTLLIPTLYVLIAKIFTDKVKEREEILQLTGFNVIGDLPLASKISSNVVEIEPKSKISEIIQSISSSINYYLLGKSNSVILITSTYPDEGKSFLSLNIATSFARQHKKTLLIDFDLRIKHTAFQELKEPGKIGLSEFLINDASKVEDLIANTGIKNLDFIYSGEVAPNPIELISHERTSTLFEELRKVYDYIVLDTPPYGLVTDSFILMRYADIKLYVSKIGIIKKSILKYSLEDLEGKGIENLYLVINNSNMVSSSYSYDKYTAESIKRWRGIRNPFYRKNRK
jgi:capsular exopolysaccharide synthesis family protein